MNHDNGANLSGGGGMSGVNTIALIIALLSFSVRAQDLVRLIPLHGDGHFGEIGAGSSEVRGKGWTIQNLVGSRVRILGVNIDSPFVSVRSSTSRLCTPQMILAANGGVCQIRIQLRPQNLSPGSYQKNVSITVQDMASSARQEVQIPLTVVISPNTFKLQLGGDGYDWPVGAPNFDRGEYNFERSALSIVSGEHVFLGGSTNGSFEDLPKKGQVDVFISKIDKGGRIVWKTQLGREGSEFWLKNLAVDGNANVFIAGDAERNNSSGFEGLSKKGGRDIFVAKFDGAGNLIWKNQFGGVSDEEMISLVVDSTGNVVLAGRTQGSFEGLIGEPGVFVTKLDSVGNMIWKKRFSGNMPSVSFGHELLAVDFNSNVILAGTVRGSFDGLNIAVGRDGEAYIIKLDSAGNVLWEKLLGGFGYDSPRSLSVDALGNSFLAGETSGVFEELTSGGGKDIFVIKLDPNGNLLWKNQVGGGQSENAPVVSLDSNGNLYLSGFSNDNLFGPVSDSFAYKFNSAGSVLWEKQLGQVLPTISSTDLHGNLFLGGIMPSNGQSDVFFIQLDSNGNEVWKRHLGSERNDFLGTLSMDSEGNAILTGATNGSFEGLQHHGQMENPDVFVIKIAPPVPQP